MPTTSQMLQRADELEARAKALRIAAAEMNGHAISGKQEAAQTTIEKAIGLRREQRASSNGHNGHAPMRKVKTRRDGSAKPEREALLREILSAAGEPMSMKELYPRLVERGITVSKSTISKALTQMPDARVTSVGYTAQWSLRGAKPERAKATAKRKPGRPPRPVPPSTLARHVKMLRKAQVVATILQEAGRPMPIKELAVAARAQGVKQLTGIYNYVKQGYVQKAGNKNHRTYSFLRLPDVAPAPA